MVADGVHILFGVALVMLLLRTRRLEPYLIAVLAAGGPDLDRYLFVPLIYRGYLSGPLWTHRGITHSLLLMVVVVAIAYAAGHWRAGAIAYGSHLAADYATGGIRLFAPFEVSLYGLYFDWMLGNVVLGTFSVIVLVVGLIALLDEADEQDRTNELTLPRLRRVLSGWFR
jgi:inner membrane protein